MKPKQFAATLAALLVVGCNAGDTNDTTESDTTAATPGAPAPAPVSARATLRDAQGRDVATALLTPDSAGGVVVELQATGVATGEHGVHLHMVGQCDAAAGFASAGEHINPSGAQHGLDNPTGPHAGDLPNLVVGADSTGRFSHTSPLAVDSLFDADGSALVIHAQRDDQRTDPSGNSGDRVACGVIMHGS